MMGRCARPTWESGDWSSASSMSSAPSSAWESEASSSASWPTSISSYSSYSEYLEISHWSDSEDEDDDGTATEHDWDASSIVTDEIELETAEQLFLSFMASMADLLKKEQRPTPAPTRPLSYAHPPQTSSPTPTESLDSPNSSPPRPAAIPHSISMPLPNTEPAPWHAPRGSTPPPQGAKEEDFSVALARMGDWEARHAASVAAAVYRRHANLAGITEDPECERWAAERGRRRQGVVGTLPLGLGLGAPDAGVQVSVVGKGIAHCAEKRGGLLHRLRRSWRR